MKLKIEYLNKTDLKPYANNAKIHTAEQVEQIKKSISQFGFNDPIAIWHDNEVIEGHGRLLAVMEMDDISEVPVIRLDDLSDEQRKAYMLAHNQLTMNSGFDLELLEEEIKSITEFDMSSFGFSINDIPEDELKEHKDIYSTKVNIPQYEPKGDEVDISDLVDLSKTNELIMEINNSNVPDEIKEFLREAAHRHSVFDYRNIAEFYAQADAEVQKLMEKSALVIIDIDDAIANGFVRLTKRVQDLIEEESGGLTE